MLFYDNNMSKEEKEKFLKYCYGNKIITNIKELEDFFRKYWKWIAETTKEKKQCVISEHFFKEKNISYNEEYEEGPMPYICDFAEFLYDNTYKRFTSAYSNYYNVLPDSLKTCWDWKPICRYCPVKDWGRGKNEKSPYYKWVESVDNDNWEDAAKYAEIISNLEFRNIFEAMSKEEAECIRREGIGEIYSQEEI